MTPDSRHIIALPWPAPILSPNDRAHWGKKAKAKTQYRSDCFYMTKHQIKGFRHAGGKIPLRVTFREPPGNKRDWDNCVASIKAGIDGVCDALRIDDSLFRPITIDFGENVSGGAVILEF